MRLPSSLLAKVFVCALLLTPSLCFALPAALVVYDGTPGINTTALANLTAHVVGKGYAVTPNIGVPGGSLAIYKQIWDIRYNNIALPPLG